MILWQSALSILFIFLALSAKAAPGKIIFAVDSQLAEVAVNDPTWQEGQSVQLYEKKCRGPRVPLCRDEKVGTAVINKIISAGLKEIRWDSGSPLKKGLIVRRDQPQ
ncbi:hypothetical protein D3C87_1510620 [compost metagenome]